MDNPLLPSKSSWPMTLLAAVFRGACGLVLGGFVGVIAEELTIGMLLARHFNSSLHARLAVVWLIACLVGGFTAGVCFPRWLNERFRWICWGAVIALAALMLLTRLPLALIPAAQRWSFFIPGISARINFEEAGFISAPGALLVGGFLGWFFHRHRHPEAPPDSPAG